jgi:hypothetical protein
LLKTEIGKRGTFDAQVWKKAIPEAFEAKALRKLRHPSRSRILTVAVRTTSYIRVRGAGCWTRLA